MTAQMDPDLAGAISEEDMKLMERIAHKDAAAFNQFYRRYGGLLFSTISKVLNDHHDAEDIMQEVMVQLWQKAHLYEPRKGKPLTWLTTMAKNRAIDRIRSKQRRSRLSEEFTAEHHVTQPEFDESGHDILQTKERDTNLRQAVTKLTRDQQQAIKLTYFDGLTQAEVAERLHEPLGTIKARIRRGVTRLEDLMRSKTR